MWPWTLKDVAEHWDRTEDYDDINKSTYSYFRRFTDSFKMSCVKDNDYMLDICCRTGNGAVYYAKRRKIKGIAMDVSDKMLNIASHFFRRENVNFKTKRFISYPLPLKDNSFDVVLSLETIEHMPYPQTFIKELYRVLKPGGELILSTPNVLWEPVHWFAAVTGIHHSEGPHRFIPRKKLLKFLRKAGFKIKNEKTTVLFAFGPRWFTRVGELIEQSIGEQLRRIICLRRIFICRK